MKKITDAYLRALRPKAGPYAESISRNLQLHVSKAGSKTWRFRWDRKGKDAKFSFAKFPGTGLAAALNETCRLQALVEAGVDLVAHHKEQERVAKAEQLNTLQALLDQFLAKRKNKVAPATRTRIDAYVRQLPNDLLKAPARSIRPRDLLKVLREIEGRGQSPKRLRALLSEAFQFGVAAELVDDDPAASLKKALQEVVTRPHPAIVEPKAFGALLRSIDGYQGQPTTRLFLMLLALLVPRPGELRMATWKEFDLGGETPTWEIPADRTKTRKPHRVPLPKQAVALLAELRALTGHHKAGRLFPSLRQSGRAMSPMTPLSALRAMDYGPDRHVPHGFRSSFSTIAGESALWTPELIEAALAHAIPGVAGVYNRGDKFQRRRALMAWWASEIDRMREEGAAVVVPMRRA